MSFKCKRLVKVVLTQVNDRRLLSNPWASPGSCTPELGTCGSGHPSCVPCSLMVYPKVTSLGLRNDYFLILILPYAWGHFLPLVCLHQLNPDHPCLQTLPSCEAASVWGSGCGGLLVGCESLDCRRHRLRQHWSQSAPRPGLKPSRRAPIGYRLQAKPGKVTDEGK